MLCTVVERVALVWNAFGGAVRLQHLLTLLEFSTLRLPRPADTDLLVFENSRLILSSPICRIIYTNAGTEVVAA